MRRVVLSMIAALALLCVQLPGFAAGERLEINPEYWAGTRYMSCAYLGDAELESLEDLSVAPGDEIRVYLEAEGFRSESGLVLAAETVKAGQLAASKIEVRYRAAAGSQALEAIGIDRDRGKSSRAYIYIRFKQELVQTREVPFEFSLYLAAGGKKSEYTEFTVSGRCANPLIEADDTVDYLDLSDGTVAEAKSYIQAVQVDLGNGLTIKASFFEGSRYYGVCTVDPAPEDDLLLEIYPEVELIYTLRTIGLKREGKDVATFDFSSRYYVYDSEGRYIGTTDGTLPYSPKYYLANQKLDSISVQDMT